MTGGGDSDDELFFGDMDKIGDGKDNTDGISIKKTPRVQDTVSPVNKDSWQWKTGDPVIAKESKIWANGIGEYMKKPEVRAKNPHPIYTVLKEGPKPPVERGNQNTTVHRK